MKLKISPKQSRFILLASLLVVSMFFAGHAWAGVIDGAVGTIVASICLGLIWILGKILIVIMAILIAIAQYNDFIHAAPVEYGWKIVRDVCNMFFVLIMLIIAFATVLQVERYNYKKLLPKLVMMAILINFSKLICGFFIDFTQVIMLTFVNGFKAIGGGNLTEMMGVTKLLSANTNSTEDVSGWTVAGAAILALIYTIVAIVVLVTMVMVLVMRIIMIWIYVVMSPMAYLLASFPQGEQYASQWWSEFSKNLIVGPVLAFFIWLSFVSLGGVGENTTVNSMTTNLNSTEQTFDAKGLPASSTAPSAAMTEAGSADHMLKFFISIAMLIGGLQISQSIGGAAGGVAGKGLSKIKSYGSKAASWSGKKAANIAKKGAAYGVAGLKTVGGTVDRGLGRVANSMRTNPKDVDKSALVTKGLVGAMVGKTGTFMKNTVSLRKNNAEREEQQKIRRTMADGAEKVTHNDVSYERQSDGSYKDKDKKDLTFNGKAPVKAMSGTEAAFYDAKRSSFSSIRSEKKTNQDKKVSEAKDEILKTDVNDDELMRKLQSSGTSRNEKQAIALSLAERGTISNADQVGLANDALSSNPLLQKKFADTMHEKGNSHLLYDLEAKEDSLNPAEALRAREAKAKVMKDFRNGKIDPSKQNDAFFKEEKMHQYAKEHFGEATYNQKFVRESEKDEGRKKAVMEGAEKAKKSTMAVDGGELINSKGNINSFAKLIAEMGEPVKAFTKTMKTINDAGAETEVDILDVKATDSFHKQAGASYISKVDFNALDSAAKDSTEGNKASAKIAEQARDSLLQNINISSIASVIRKGDSNKNVSGILKGIKESGVAGLNTQRNAVFHNNIVNNFQSNTEV